MTVSRTASLPWLVRHELRLALRDGSAGRRRGKMLALLVLMLFPAVGGVALALNLAPQPDVPREVFGLVVASGAGLVLLMLSGACVYVLRSFHDRGDLDLLLAAPIPPSRVLAAKSVAVHASVSMPLLVLTAPFVITSVFVGHPGWIGGSIMIVIAAIIATSLAFVIASALFRGVGARRARIVIQVGGGLFAATVAILGQAPNFAPDFWHQFLRALDVVPLPPFDWPAQAVFGAPGPLLAMLVLALGSGMISSKLAARSLADAAAVAPPIARNTRVRPFRTGVLRILLVKELRLLWRDPELLSAVALQLAYMIPAFGLIFAGGGVSSWRLAAATVLFAGLLPSSLAWLTICGEDAPELIDAAPVPVIKVARAKLLAACLPALAIAIVPLTVIFARDVRAALVALPLCMAAALAAAIQQLWLGKPQPRRSFRHRQGASILLAVSEYLMAGSWSACAALLVRGSPWAPVPAVVALLVFVASGWPARWKATGPRS